MCLHLRLSLQRFSHLLSKSHSPLHHPLILISNQLISLRSERSRLKGLTLLKNPISQLYHKKRPLLHLLFINSHPHPLLRPISKNHNTNKNHQKVVLHLLV